MFTAQELGFLEKAIFLVAALPDIPGLRCHEVARAVGKILDLQVQDGHYGLVEHSWLWTKPWKWGTYPPSILDVYCVGSMPMVRLIDVNCMGLPHLCIHDELMTECSRKNTGYRPEKDRTDIHEEMVEFLVRSLAVDSPNEPGKPRT